MKKACTRCKARKEWDIIKFSNALGLPRQPCRECAKKRGKRVYTPQQLAARATLQRGYLKDPIYYKQHHEMSKAAEKKNRHKHVRRALNGKLRLRYNITVEQYEQMLITQNGVCAICRRQELNGKRLSVDHDHGTKIVRGLLCQFHNMGLGLFQDDPALLRAAADYLERSR